MKTTLIFNDSTTIQVHRAGCRDIARDLREGWNASAVDYDYPDWHAMCVDQFDPASYHDGETGSVAQGRGDLNVNPCALPELKP